MEPLDLGKIPTDPEAMRVRILRLMERNQELFMKVDEVEELSFKRGDELDDANNKLGEVARWVTEYRGEKGDEKYILKIARIVNGYWFKA